MRKVSEYLGLTISKTNTHIDNTCSSAFHKLNFLRRQLMKTQSSVRLLARNTIEICQPCLGSLHKKEHFKAGNGSKVGSSMEDLRLDSPFHLMKRNGIATLELRRKLSRLKFLFHTVRNKVRLGTHNHLIPLMTRPTRHHNEYSLAPIFARTHRLKSSFFPRTISTWNSFLSSVFEAADFCDATASYFS